MSQTLAVKYRPKTWNDITEQAEIKTILEQQLRTNSIKNSYLFCGPAGCGKTTAARIFANDINNNQGNPIEIDAASNSGVDDVRNIIQQAKTKSLDSEYKIFIVDECHSISNTGWQAFLKLIEEPPAKSVFIFCTTNPEKIPKTILSRVQRYDFHRISYDGIVQRLDYIFDAEFDETSESEVWMADMGAFEFIAKLADGGMRDAITMLDKCLSYCGGELSVENVVKALGVSNNAEMFNLTFAIYDGDEKQAIDIIEDLYNTGIDIKIFVKQYIQFLLDVVKYSIGCDWSKLQIPKLKDTTESLDRLAKKDYIARTLLSYMVNLNADIKYSQTAKYDFEVAILSAISEVIE